MFSEKRAIVSACAASAALILSTCASAQTQVFVDNFKNGSVQNSDTQPNFWQSIQSNAVSNATEPVGGPLNLFTQSGAAGDHYPFSEIGTTATQSSFNFFQQPIILSASGLDFGNSTLNALTEFNFGSNVLSTTLRPAGTPAGQPPFNTEYDEPSDFSLEISPPNAANGQINMGLKTGYPEHSTPFDAYRALGFLTPTGAIQLGGQIRAFTLVLGSQFYYLNVTSDTSPTNSTPVTTTYSGNLNITNGAWSSSSPTYVPGDPVLNVETQLNNTTNTTDIASLNVGQIKVSQMTMTFTPNVLDSANDGGYAWFAGTNDPNQAANSNWSGLTNVIDSSSINQIQGGLAQGNLEIPDYVSASATLPQATGPTQIDIDNGAGNTVTIGTLNINSTQPYTINGSNVQLATNGSTGQVNVTAGNHIVNANMNLFGNTTFNIAAGASLTVNGFLIPQGTSFSPVTLAETLTMSGGGRTAITGAQLFQNVVITGGTLQMTASPTANDGAGNSSLIGSLTISPGGHLDLTNNAMVIQYTGGSPLQTIRQYLHTGGIMSSTASLPKGTTVGYAEASEIGQTSNFNQIPTNSTSIILAYAYFGDLNLDGSVSGSDYTQMASGNGTDWYQGDLNYDGVKNADDWALFQLGVAASARGNINGLPAPEPGVLSMAALGTVGLLGRRRRA